MTQDEVEEIYIAYLIIKGNDSLTATDTRALKYLKRIINKYGEGWRL